MFTKLIIHLIRSNIYMMEVMENHLGMQLEWRRESLHKILDKLAFGDIVVGWPPTIRPRRYFP